MSETRTATNLDRLMQQRKEQEAEADRLRKFVYHNRKIDPTNPLYDGDELRRAVRRLNRLFEAGYGKRPGVYHAIDGGIYLGHPDKERTPLFVDCFGEVFICDVNDAGQLIRTEGVIDDDDFSEFIQGSKESLRGWRESEREKSWWHQPLPFTAGNLIMASAVFFLVSWLAS